MDFHCIRIQTLTSIRTGLYFYFYLITRCSPSNLLEWSGFHPLWGHWADMVRKLIPKVRTLTEVLTLEMSSFLCVCCKIILLVLNSIVSLQVEHFGLKEELFVYPVPLCVKEGKETTTSCLHLFCPLPPTKAATRHFTSWPVISADTYVLVTQAVSMVTRS